MFRKKWTVDSRSEGKRLLAFVKNKFEKKFATQDLRWSIEHQRCRVNGEVERFCSRRMSLHDQIEVFPLQKPLFALERDRVLHEEEGFLAYNKPPYISSPDLAELLGLSLVHRLDRDTTGVIILAKNRGSLRELEELFRKRKVQKSYLAWVVGKPKTARGMINAPMAKIGQRAGEVTWGVATRGLRAKTEWICERREKGYSLLRCQPQTGRTHQIRVHLLSIGHPIVGDVRYGSRKTGPIFRPLLHAEKITIGDREIIAPIPQDFKLVFS